MIETEITEFFLKALNRHLKGEILMDEAVEEAHLKTRKQFQERMKVAYARHMLIVRPNIDSDLGERVREWIGPAKRIEAYIVKGTPNDEIFYSKASEKFLIFLQKLLLDDKRDEINIGIVSGTSTAELIEQVSEGGFWQEIMEGLIFERKNNKDKNKKRKINVVAICSTTLEGWDLEGNANISTLRLAKTLKKNLPNFEITPYGISTELVISEDQRDLVDERISNREILKIVDPSRINSVKNPESEEKSKLDILLTGVGIWNEGDQEPESVFQKVIQKEDIMAPANQIVGDVGFWAVNKDGEEIELSKNGKKIMIYSLIRLKTMRDLARENGIVMLIARNQRRGTLVRKEVPIRAAIRGSYVNVIFTDADTANAMLQEPI